MGLLTATVSNDMTAKSQALSAAAAPASMKIVAQTEHVDSITLGTHLMFDVSRDGGTTWTTATMNDRFTSNSIHVLKSDAINVSGQPTGTSIKWRIRTASNKTVKVHGIYVYWS